MATPALRALRRRFPDAHLAAHGKKHLLTLLEGSPLVDEVPPAPARGARAMLTAARELRARGFDWAVLLAESERAALLARLSGIPLRAGLFHTAPRRWLLSHPVPARALGGRAPRALLDDRALPPGHARPRRPGRGRSHGAAAARAGDCRRGPAPGRGGHRSGRRAGGGGPRGGVRSGEFWPRSLRRGRARALAAG